VLDQNPLKVAPVKVSEIKVLQVYLAGVPWVNSELGKNSQNVRRQKRWPLD